MDVWTSDDGDILYVRPYGSPDAEAIRAHAGRVMEAVETLSDEFGIVTDLREFEPLLPDESDAIERAQEYLLEAGAVDVVRVVDDDTSRVVLLSFKMETDDTRSPNKKAESIEEAEAMLDV